MKKKIAVSQYRDWSEVDRALRRLGEIDVMLTRLEGEMTLKTNELKESYEKQAEGIRAERKKIERAVESFAVEKKEEFTKTRSKELAFGTISFRVVHRLLIKSRKATVAALEAMGLQSCLRVTKEPDKEAMKSLDPGSLAKAGALLKTEDQISIEPHMTRLSDREAA